VIPTFEIRTCNGVKFHCTSQINKLTMTLDLPEMNDFGKVSINEEMPGKMVNVSDTLAGNPLIFGLIVCCMLLLIVAKVRQNGKFKFLILSFYRGKGIIQPFKEQRVMLSAASILLMTNFLVMIGLFGYYSIQILGFPGKPVYESIGFFQISVFVTCCYIVKLTLIKFVKFLLGVDKGNSEYSYTIILFCQNLGLLLFPLIVTITYIDMDYRPTLVIFAMVIVGLLYLFRIFKAISISIRESIPFLYLFLYLCAFEFSPLVVALKIVIG